MEDEGGRGGRGNRGGKDHLETYVENEDVAEVQKSSDQRVSKKRK